MSEIPETARGRCLSSLLLAASLLACGPIGPIPGTALRGNLHHGTVQDWSFTDAAHTIQLETNSQDPHSVNTWCVGYGPNLYIPSSLILGTEDPSERGWIRNVLEDPLVRVRIDGTLYELNAARVTEATELDAVRARLFAKYDEVEPGDEQAEQAWIFRLESHSRGSTAASGADIGLFDDIGDLHHPISTQSKTAQRYFDQGLTLTYGFNHQAAERSFREAARQDPECAMCWWGVALALGPNINMPMGPGAEAAAVDAINRALALVDGASDADRAYIDALASRYGSEPPAQRGHRDRAYAESMRGVYEKHPSDLDAAVLFAESLMMLSPWDYWTADSEPRAHTLELLGALESVMARDPNHMGAIHFYIHAVEDPYPERAEAGADRLAKLAPSSTGHLIHMPSHIYWRLGRYGDAGEINQRAAAADEDFFSWCRSQGIYDADYYPHNLHFLWAVASTQGNSDLALTSAQRLQRAIPDGNMERFPHVEAYLPTPLFTLARFGRWDDILGLAAPEQGGPYTQGIWHYVRGLALLRTGQPELAQDELLIVSKWAASEDMQALGFVVSPAATLLRLAELHLEGELQAVRGELDVAVASLREAVRIQDALPYTEPPPWYLPNRLALGAVLLEAERAVEAEAVYRVDLEQYPANGWALFGLAQSIEAQGRVGEADIVRAGFANAWSSADVELSSSRF